MCLIVKNTVPTELKFLYERTILYKCFQIEDGKLLSAYQFTRYNPGFNIAISDPNLNINMNNLYYGMQIFSGAIHVWTSIKKAYYDTLMHHKPIIVPVICFRKDFIAEGHYCDACFNKVYVTKRNYDRALKAEKVDELLF